MSFREPCATHREVSREASAGGYVGGAIEHRKERIWSAEAILVGRRQHRRRRYRRAAAGLRGVEELTHAYTSSTGTWEGCASSRRIVRRDRIGEGGNRSR